MLSCLLRSAEVGRLTGAKLLWRSFVAVKVKGGQLNRGEEEEESQSQHQKKIVEKLGIVDQHVSGLRENLGTQWIRKLDFDSKIKPALNKFKELGFKEEDLNILAKKWPDGLVLNNNPDKKMDIFELSKHLESRYGIKSPETIRRIVTSTPDFMMVSSDGLDERVDRLANFLQLDQVNFYQQEPEDQSRQFSPKPCLLPPKES